MRHADNYSHSTGGHTAPDGAPDADETLGVGDPFPIQGLGVLPPEVVRVILLALDDADFGACMRAGRLFHAHTWADYIERRYGRMTQPRLVESAPLEAIEFLYARGRFHPTMKDTAHAARNRRANLFSWLDARQKCRTCACPIRRGLAQGGDVEFAKRFFEGADRNALLHSMEMAAGRGQTDMVAWLAERASLAPGDPELEVAASAALCEWRVETAQWLLDHGTSGWGTTGPLRKAMEKIGPDVVMRWVVDGGYEQYVTVNDLCDHNSTCHPSILDWKMRFVRGRDWNNRWGALRFLANNVAKEAALCGRVDILRDMEARTPGTLTCRLRAVSRAAVEGGHLDAVGWVLGDAPPLDNLKSATKGAIMAKRWHILDALAERYSALLAGEWESIICKIAHVGIDALERASALYGSDGSAAMFADARWISQAIANVGCNGGSLDVIEYLCKRHGTMDGIPAPPSLTPIGARGDLDILCWLHERLGWNGGNEVLPWVVFNGHAKAVRYLCAQGLGSPQQLYAGTTRHAAAQGYVKVFKVLHDHGLGNPAFSHLLHSAIEGAIKGHQADLVAWLCDTYPHVREWALTRVEAFECPPFCKTPRLMFADVDLDWMRVMRQYAFGK